MSKSKTKTAEPAVDRKVTQKTDISFKTNGQPIYPYSAGRAIPKAVSPQPVPDSVAVDHPSLYFNQELGWIDFNWRVLYQAQDDRLPLLERVRFIAITASNLDEFVQKRVGGLMRQEAARVSKLSPDGRTPESQLDLVREAVRRMHFTITDTWEHTLKPLLAEQAGVVICNFTDLNPKQQEPFYYLFKSQIYPILTPLTVDPGHPFPFISNLSLNLGVILRHKEKDTPQFARLKVPNMPRWLRVNYSRDDGRFYFVLAEQMIAHYIDELFPGMNIVGVHPFRVTRNADVSRDEEVAEDLLSLISEELRERRFAPVVRLEVDQGMPEEERQLIVEELDLGREDVHEVDGLLDLTACFQLADLEFPELKYRHWEPVVPNRVYQKQTIGISHTIFSIIRQGDILVHHPYEAFTATTQRLIEEAAIDEKVLAIKLTLYRTSAESPIVKALMQAAELGKQVAVLVEVKARFDEANNIEWARMMEDAGIHVAYGLVGLKTHTKATLIVRREAEGIRTYCHIGTGNYHPKTARLYTDLGLLTCNPELGRDIINLFHFLTGYAPGQTYSKVLIAPKTMRQRFNELIEQEVRHQQDHGTGRIIVKMNGLDDVPIIQKLYQASQAGVQIDLIIRGHSRLRPGLKGYSDNIRVISILGRFLEHDRIFYFHNNDRPQLFIGSADWRGRNLNDRVELITPIEEPTLKRRLIQTLNDALNDNCLAWDLDAEGNYVQRVPPSQADERRNFHETLMQRALES